MRQAGSPTLTAMEDPPAPRAGQVDPIVQVGRAAEQRSVVVRALEQLRVSGVPRTQVDLAAEAGITVGAFRKHERDYFAEVKADLLGRVVQDEAEYQAWLALYRCFSTRIKAAREARAVHRRLVRLSIENLDRTGRPVTYSAIDTLSRLGAQRVAAELLAWEAETGRKRERADVWQPVTLDTVLPLIDPALHAMPLTFLDDLPGNHRPLSETNLRAISGLATQGLRDTAFLCLTVSATTHSNERCFFGSMAEFLPVLGLADLGALDPDAFYPAFHDRTLFPELSDASRVNHLQMYFRLLRRQDAYFERLKPEQARKLAPFRLRPVTSTTFWHRSGLWTQVADDRRKRRKAATAAVHDKFYLFRNIADRRVNQLVRLRKAFWEACERVRHNPGTPFPLAFSYSEEAVTPSGASRRVAHSFRLWDGHTLRRLHAPLAPKLFYADREGLPGFECGADGLYVSLESSSAEGDTVEESGFWFVELVRSGGLTWEPDPEFLAAQGYGTGKAFFPPVRSDWPRSVGRWLKRIALDLDMLFLPVGTLLGTGLAGNAALQVMTKTGARVGETLQIRLTHKHLTRASLPGGKEAIAFHAIPKGRAAEEPFYIDVRCLKALEAWFEFLREHQGEAAVVPATYALRPKCKPAPYLFQFAGRHFETTDLNACLRILLHGVEVSTAEGETVLLSAHLLRHGFATELRGLGVPIDVIALLLKQRDVEVTRYYAQATPAQLIQEQERIFTDRIDLTRTHIRTPEEIHRQVEEARGKVGALIRVLGGTCTVANWCPAKFACVGCAGNAPDPARRSEVDEFMRLYEATVKLAASKGLPAEVSKARARVAAAQDTLAEMDLIEAAERDAGLLAEVSFSKSPSSRRRRGAL